jgi:hypothetical protein
MRKGMKGSLHKPGKETSPEFCWMEQENEKKLHDGQCSKKASHKCKCGVLLLRPFFSPHGATAPSGPGPPHYRGYTIALTHQTR